MTDKHDPIARNAVPSAVDCRIHGARGGVPAYMTRAEIRILVEERERLAALFEVGDRSPDAVSGLGTYALSDREKFWSEIVEIFTSGRLGEEIIREASPRLYDMLRVFFWRTDLPPSGVARG